MSSPREKYWFPAKRYGWGWGFPTCWQGWLVFTAYFALFALGMVFFGIEARNNIGFIVYMTAITLALVLVCWKKGEPPRWRWGGDKS